MPERVYSASGVQPAFRLYYSWTGWPEHSNWDLSAVPKIVESLRHSCASDRLHFLEHRVSPETLQVTFSATPDICPVFLAGRAKGRLQHALKGGNVGFPGFTRKLSVRSVGENHRTDVENYIASQVHRSQFVDPGFQDLLRQFTVCCPEVDLSQPAETARGRYWYNLHLVLVTAHRYCVADARRLAILREWSFAIATKKGYLISRLSVMPDHLHACLRGDPDHSPRTIALAFQNNLAYALGQERIWEEGYYVGTFSEYNMDAIRRNR